MDRQAGSGSGVPASAWSAGDPGPGADSGFVGDAPYHSASRAPSGLFPTRPAARPTYREPFPVRAGALAGGLAGTTSWMLVFSLLAVDLVSYVWWTLLAGVVAWLVALLLVLHGDRGVAAGISISAGLAWSVAGAAIAARWTTTGDWPLW